MKTRLFIFTAALFCTLILPAQQEARKLVQIDGIVTDETNYPLRYVNIISKSLSRGATTGENGIFSIIGSWGDTLIFTSVGYKPAVVKLPDIIPSAAYSIDVVMEADTFNIGNVLVLPWKTYEDFKRAVVEYIPEDEKLSENMARNMEIIEEQMYADITTSPEAGYRYAMQRETENVMTRNQTPVNNLLNPFAWAKFFDGIKNGLFRNEKSSKKKSKNNKEEYPYPDQP